MHVMIYAVFRSGFAEAGGQVVDNIGAAHRSFDHGGVADITPDDFDIQPRELCEIARGADENSHPLSPTHERLH
jgi:hypothetical protein